MKKLRYEPGIFLPTIALVIVFCVWVFWDPDKANTSLQGAFTFITDSLGWLYNFVILGFTGLCLFFALSPLGKKRLGDEAPEFSTASWLGMIFTGFAGVGVLTWGTIEFFYYMEQPPFGIEPFSNAAKPWALSYPLLHWGFTVYCSYIFLGLIFAYLFYVKKKDVVRPSSAAFLSDRRAKSWLGTLVDVLFVVGMIGGLSTCLGVNMPTVFSVIHAVFGLERSFWADTAIIMSWTVCMSVLLYFGLQKGIKYLSDFRVYFGFALLIFLLLAGPTQYILNTFSDTLGHFGSNFLRMALATDPHDGSRLPQDWSAFYYAWYIALGLQSAIFLGRISRGRTVRQFLLGAIVASTTACWVFFMVFSNFSMHVLEQGAVPLQEIMHSGGQGAAIVAIWSQFPLSKILMPLLMVYAYIAMLTLLNGGTYTLALTTSRNAPGQEPPQWIRIFWSLALGGITVALVSIGGIRVSQSMTIITSIPALAIMVMIVITFFRDLKTTWLKPETAEISRESASAPDTTEPR